MSRLEITIGLLAIVGAIVVIAGVGLGEVARMEREARGWDARSIEAGAELFERHCSACHGPNAVGGTGPPLDETSGLHGGDVASGVAWRLEELGWRPTLPFEYVLSTTAAGRAISTRPDVYAGNRLAGGDGTGRVLEMAMPAHGEAYGGELRADQLEALAEYIVAFRDAIPADPDEALVLAAKHRLRIGSSTADSLPESPTSVPTATLEGATLED